MKTVNLLTLLFIAQFLFAQNQKSRYELGKNIIIPFDTTLGYVSSIGLNQSNLFDLYLVQRQLYKNSNNVKFEYIRLEKDTFMYVEYDKANPFKVIKKGLVYASSDCPRVDTLVIYKDGNIEKPQLTVIFSCIPYKKGFWQENISESQITGTYQNNEKEGNWIEKQGDIELKGAYQNNKKQGIWHYLNYTKYDFRDLDYRNDTLTFERQYNIVKIKNLDSLKSYIIGAFSKHYNTFERVNNFEINDHYYNNRYEFKADGQFTFQRFKQKKIVEEKKGNWDVSLKYLNLHVDNDEVYSFKLLSVNTNAIIFDDN